MAQPTAPTTPPPNSVVSALANAAGAEGFQDVELSASIWIEGWGEVLAVNPDLALTPASNQKLLVAYAALEILGRDHRFVTDLALNDTDSGVDLVVRAGGDPTLTLADIEALLGTAAAAVNDATRLVVDLGAYNQPPRATQWLDWQIPRFVGPLSGLMVDANRWAATDALVEAPAQANGDRIAAAAREMGISVDDVVVADDGYEAPTIIATHESAPVDALVGNTLRTSNNQIADMLVVALGHELAGEGTLASGIEVMDTALRQLMIPSCGSVTGVSDDGSGLSRGNERSAREFQELLRAMQTTEAGRRLAEQLPVGGVSGTLSNRFSGDIGRVAAKTGTLRDGRALSGYAVTDSGRNVVFSIITNGDSREDVARSLPAIDALVTAALRS